MDKLDRMFPNGLWRMGGTEKTFTYTVRAASLRGRVGVRHLPGDNVRIRLEPVDTLAESVMKKWQAKLPRSVGYKQPGDGKQRRFSTIATKGDSADKILAIMFDLLGKEAGLKSFTLNPDMDKPMSTMEAELA